MKIYIVRTEDNIPNGKRDIEDVFVNIENAKATLDGLLLDEIRAMELGDSYIQEDNYEIENEPLSFKISNEEYWIETWIETKEIQDLNCLYNKGGIYLLEEKDLKDNYYVESTSTI